MRGIYIHIPFCVRKCYYCDFISFEKKFDMVKKYTDALKKEIKYRLKPNEKIDTIYIGGGTPSSIDSTYVKEILEEIYGIIGQDKTREVTIEVNPGTLTIENVNDYKEAKINRISLGLQETDDELLKTIGRIHNYEQFLFAYNMLKEAGFKNINVDLMLGLPKQKIQNLENSIEKISKLKPKHISIYSLILEEGTKLEELINNKTLKLPSDTTERKMYWKVKELLEKKGYMQYEISNFAKAGYESKHNMNCWKQHEYYGFGLAAHSYINNIRYSNTENLDEYIENIENNEYNKIRQTNEIQTKESKMQEYMMLKLRTIEGVQIQEYKRIFQENPLFIFKEKIENLANKNLIEVDGDNIKLTNKGLDYANIVWQEFV